MISLAKDSQAPRLGRHSVFIFRAILATIWLYWGIRFGIAHQEWGATANGQGLANSLGLTVPGFSVVVGGVFIAMAVWLISGLASRAAVFVQFLLLFFVWWLRFTHGLAFLDALVEQLPMLCLILMLWNYGPGTFVWARNRSRTSTWTRG